jgi:hypothetical protein
MRTTETQVDRILEHLRSGRWVVLEARDEPFDSLTPQTEATIAALEA